MMIFTSFLNLEIIKQINNYYKIKLLLILQITTDKLLISLNIHF